MTSSDNTTASATRNEQLMLFEGIVLGIYGNWLVTLIQLVSFTATLIAIQVALSLVSLVSLIALLAIGVFGGKLENHYVVLMLAFLHFIPLCITLAMERLLIQDAFFLMIGGILFSMIYMAEHTRARNVERMRFTS
jgi:hypothetical membrane protein